MADGEAVDVVVNAAQNIDRQSKDGRLAAATRTDFAESGIGVAVPSSSAKMDVSTQEALKNTLLSATSVVVSSGTSSRHMVEVFDKLGIGEQLKAKTKQPPSGAQIADYLAGGDADIGFQQISKLLHAKGINYLGPLPADLQNHTDHLPQRFGQINSLAAENATDGTSATNPNARHSPFTSGATGQRM